MRETSLFTVLLIVLVVFLLFTPIKAKEEAKERIKVVEEAFRIPFY